MIRQNREAHMSSAREQRITHRRGRRGLCGSETLQSSTWWYLDRHDCSHQKWGMQHWRVCVLWARMPTHNRSLLSTYYVQHRGREREKRGMAPAHREPPPGPQQAGSEQGSRPPAPELCLRRTRSVSKPVLHVSSTRHPEKGHRLHCLHGVRHMRHFLGNCLLYFAILLRIPVGAMRSWAGWEWVTRSLCTSPDGNSGGGICPEEEALISAFG